jgi:hypothetical protein
MMNVDLPEFEEAPFEEVQASFSHDEKPTLENNGADFDLYNEVLMDFNGDESNKDGSGTEEREISADLPIFDDELEPLPNIEGIDSTLTSQDILDDKLPEILSLEGSLVVEEVDVETPILPRGVRAKGWSIYF